MSFNPGEQVGPYRIMEQLGQGGMATVFKAYHPSLDRFIAIKVLHQAFLEDPNFTARFQREARVVARLEHANIVPIYDYAEHEGRPYLVMKFIEGETLKARLHSGPLTPGEVEEIVTSIGAGLAYAHRQGILHRDIKPSNVMMAKDGSIYLADFGLARIAQSGESTLTTDMILGTPQYISPEQAMAKKDLDEGTDIYSFGVMLYEMTVGRVPFSGDTPFAVIHDHIYAPLPLPSEVNPSIAPDLERVLLKSLAKDRPDRYKDVPEMIRAFKEAWKSQTATLLAASQPDSAPGAVPVPSTATGSAPLTVRAEPETLPPPSAASAPTVPPEPQAAQPAPASETKKRKALPRWVWIASTGVLLVLCVVAGALLLRARARRLAAPINATRTAAAAATNTPIPIPPSPTLPPPPPKPTRTPAQEVSSLPAGVLYQDHFDGGKLGPGWGAETNWKVENGALCGSGNGFAGYRAGKDWSNYAIKLRLKMNRGAVHLNLRQRNLPIGLDRYFFEIAPERSALTKQNVQKFNELAGIKYPFESGQWYDVELVAQGNRLVLLINGLRVLDFIDPEAIESGFFSFELLQNASACMDDILVTDLTGQPPYGLLYEQHFDNETALTSWTMADAQGNPNQEWRLQDGAFCGSGHNWAVLSIRTFKDFETTFRMTLTGQVQINFRTRLDPWARYILGVNTDMNFVALVKDVRNNDRLERNTGKMSFKPGEWYQLSIAAVGDRIVFRVNERLVYDFTDKTPLGEGVIGFESLNENIDAPICIDDMMVWQAPYIPQKP